MISICIEKNEKVNNYYLISRVWIRSNFFHRSNTNNHMQWKKYFCLISSGIKRPAAALMIIGTYAKLIRNIWKSTISIFSYSFMSAQHIWLLMQWELFDDCSNNLLWFYNTVIHNRAGLCCHTGRVSAHTSTHKERAWPSCE